MKTDYFHFSYCDLKVLKKIPVGWQLTISVAEHNSSLCLPDVNFQIGVPDQWAALLQTHMEEIRLTPSYFNPWPTK